MRTMNTSFYFNCDEENFRGSLRKTWELLKRVFNWKIDDICISDDENIQLDENTSTNKDDERCLMYRCFIVWRSTLILSIIPLAFITFILQALKVREDLQLVKDLEAKYRVKIMKDIGLLSLIATCIAGFVLIVGLGYSYYYRFKVKKSMKIFHFMFAVVVIIKFIPALIQADFKRNVKGMDDKALSYLRFRDALEHALQLVPLIVSFPRGATQASFIVFGMATTSVTARVLLMFFYPYATLLLVLAASTLTQIAADKLLSLSLACFFISDFCMYYTYAFIMESDIKALIRSKRNKAKLILKISGIVLFVIWLGAKVYPCTDPDKTSPECHAFNKLQITKLSIFLNLITFLRNLFLSKVLFGDIIVSCGVQLEPDLEEFEYFKLIFGTCTLESFKGNVSDTFIEENISDSEIHNESNIPNYHEMAQKGDLEKNFHNDENNNDDLVSNLNEEAEAENKSNHDRDIKSVYELPQREDCENKFHNVEKKIEDHGSDSNGEKIAQSKTINDDNIPLGDESHQEVDIEQNNFHNEGKHKSEVDKDKYHVSKESRG